MLIEILNRFRRSQEPAPRTLMTPAPHPSSFPLAGCLAWLRIVRLLGALLLGIGIPFTAPALAEPLDAAGYAERCSEHTRDQNWQAAVADCSAAIRLDSGLVDAWLDRCWASVSVGEVDQAVADCREGLRLDPANARGYIIQGYMKTQGLQDYHGALADFNKAASLNPDVVPYHEMGNARFGLKDYRGAIDDFTRSLKSNPEHSAMTLRRRGDAKRALQDLQGAIVDYEQVIALEPNDHSTPIYLGEMIFLQGRSEAGCASFRKGVAMGSLQEVLQEATPPLDPAYLKACQ